MWIELNSKRASPLLLGFVYRNPTKRVDWTDNFIFLMDAVWLESKEIILLGDFNTDLLKPNKSRLQTLEKFHLYQLISTLTRVTATSKTLIDHINVANKLNIIETCVPVFGCSGHVPVCLTLLKKGVKRPQDNNVSLFF